MDPILVTHWVGAKKKLEQVVRTVGGRRVTNIYDQAHGKCSETWPCRHEPSHIILQLDDGTFLEVHCDSVAMGVIEMHYFPLVATHFTQYAQGYAQWVQMSSSSSAVVSCDSCGSESVTLKCSHCEAVFCGHDCAKIEGGGAVGAHGDGLKQATYLHYMDTNYIFGVKNDFYLQRESQMVTDSVGNVLFGVGDQRVKRIFALVDMDAFHRRTPADHAQCCDQPYSVIEYGSQWVAPLDALPALRHELLALYKEGMALLRPARQDVVHETTMRVRSSMPGKKK